jgi:hypothetical protein
MREEEEEEEEETQWLQFEPHPKSCTTLLMIVRLQALIFFVFEKNSYT